MGKPYARELDAFPQAFDWANTADIASLIRWVRTVDHLPLIAVGSGGSYSTAAFAAHVHTAFTGRVAKAITPLEFVSSPLHLPGAAVMLFTAGGGNPDILASLDRLNWLTPIRFGVFCAKVGSPLAEAAKAMDASSVHEYELPSGKDGFLATNSLLASAVLITRGYLGAFDADTSLAPDLASMLGSTTNDREFRVDIEGRCRQLWERDTTLVLYTRETLAAAIDLESKFTEAAIGHLQMADYRNFAHGRHFWLARNGSTTGVISLETSADEPLATRTLRLFPDNIPVVRFPFSQGPLKSEVAALVTAMYVAGAAGAARGIDPGRPTVPTFGRKLYHLGGLAVPAQPVADLSTEEAVAIERKSGRPTASLHLRRELSGWRAAYSTFVSRLQKASFGAAVFDYDGTLCGAAERYSGPAKEVGERLTYLLDAGVLIGIATGRGKSVRTDLRRLLPRKSLWNRVLVGYHNGGEIGWLSDGGTPPETTDLHESLRPIEQELRSGTLPRGLKSLEAKLQQITLETKQETDTERIWAEAEDAVRNAAVAGVSLVRSSHSIDVLAPGVSKRALVDRVRSELTKTDSSGSILCIGDKGRRPGNDYLLLDHPDSLSVDEVSENPETCWNLADPGTRCVVATLKYLRMLKAADGVFSVEM